MQKELTINTLRFNKGNAKERTLKFPLTVEGMQDILTGENCDLVNPCVGNSYGYKIPDTFNVKDAMWEVNEVRDMVVADKYPKMFMDKYNPFTFELSKELPKAFTNLGLSNKRPEQLANIVFMDRPEDAIVAIQKWLVMDEKANVRTHTPKYKNFIETVCSPIKAYGQGIEDAIKKIFEIKYYFGIPRPEEVYNFITKRDGKLITAYDVGCPCHPSTGQGHLAILLGGVLPLFDIFKLTDRQVKIILECVYLWGQYRCLAGVHHGIDAIMSILVIGDKNINVSKFLKPEITNTYYEGAGRFCSCPTKKVT